MDRLKNFVGALALALLAPAAAFAQPDTGGANFTRYVAVGDSLTAGFMSGSLYRTAQINSYPALLHRQATGQTTGFEQPLISDPGLPAQLQLSSLVPLSITPRAGQGTLTNPLITRPYNNLAVPGSRVRDVLLTTTGGLHDVVLQQFSPALQGRTALQQAVQLNPTFVTLWIGNNDVLAAATSGVVIDGVTLTPVAQFEVDLRTIATTLTQNGARMAIATIPDVTVIPFVNTLSRFLTNPQTNQPVLVNGQPVPLIGPNGPLTAGDRVLLTATAELQKGNGIPAALGGSGKPLPDTAFLTASELATISARVQAFNNVIRAVANERNAALVDTNALLTRAAQGEVGVGGITLTPAFLTGGLFSYDGVHPNAIGYAFIANEFIAAINEKFDAEIPAVNLYPFLFGPQSSVVLPAADIAAAAEPAGDGAPGFVFTAEAKKSLFWALRIPENPTKKRPGGKKGGRK